MSASALVSGKLQRDPERKTSKAGKPFVTATLREGDGDNVNWWTVLTFAEVAIDELLTLKAGDGMAASGSFKAEVYEKNGERRVSFSLFADRVISARKQKRERQGRQTEDPQDRSQAGRFYDEFEP